MFQKAKAWYLGQKLWVKIAIALAVCYAVFYAMGVQVPMVPGLDGSSGFPRD